MLVLAGACAVVLVVAGGCQLLVSHGRDEQQQHSGTVQWHNREPSVIVVQYSTAALAVQYCTAEVQWSAL